MTEKTATEALQEQITLLIARLGIVETQRNEALNREVIATANAAVLQQLQTANVRKIATLEKRIAAMKAEKSAPDPTTPE